MPALSTLCLGLSRFGLAADSGRHNGQDGAVPTGIARVQADSAARHGLARLLEKAVGADRGRRGLPGEGPLLGSAGALALCLAGVAFDSRPLKALAFLGFFINLFNLLPVVPLDGGRITGALHPALWLVGFLALVGLVFYRPNPILIIILIFGASELWRRWQMRRYPEMQEYYRVAPKQRAIIGALYFGLAILLVLGMHATHVPRSF